MDQRRRRRRSLRAVDACMLGSASGISATASTVLNVNVASITSDGTVSALVVVALGQLVTVALALSLWRFVARGGVPTRARVVGRWQLGAAGLVALALAPTDPGWLFAGLAVAAMATLGTGLAVGYLEQAYALEATSEPSVAAGQAQRWTLLVGVLSSLATGVVGSFVGWRWSVGGVGAAIAVVGACHAGWAGLPAPRRTVGSSLRAVLMQSPSVARDVKAGAYTYAVWQAVYVLPALLGAGALALGLLAAVPRLVAATSVVWSAAGGERHPRQTASWGSAVAMLGVLACAGACAHGAWWAAGLALCLAEAGFNGVASTLKGRVTRRGVDPVNQQLVMLLARYAAGSLAGATLSFAWWYLPRRVSETEAAIIVALLGCACLARVMRDVVSPTWRAAKHVAKARGRLVLLALPGAEAAITRWLAVSDGPGWRIYALPVDTELRCEGATRRGRRVLFALRLLGGRARRARWSPTTVVPLSGAWRRLTIVDADDRPIGTLSRFVDEPVIAHRSVLPWTGLPADLRRELSTIVEARAQLAFGRDVAQYVLTGPALDADLWVRAHIHA